jgi:hypothetical protein
VPLREEGTGTGPPAGSTPRPGSSRASSCAWPEVLDVPRPRPRQVNELKRRRPDLVFTGLTDGTRQLYGPSLVRKSGSYEKKTCRPAHRRISPGPIVARVRRHSRADWDVVDFAVESRP